MEKVKVVVNKDEEYASGQARESSALKEECEADLAEALPALQAARQALDTLKVLFGIHFVVFYKAYFFIHFIFRWNFIVYRFSYFYVLTYNQ